MTAQGQLAQFEKAALVDTRFSVPGIRCAGCIAKIERELPKLDGVESARVNFSNKRVAVRHDPELDEKSLTDALLRLGFEAQPLASNPLGTDHAETRNLLRALAVAGFGMMNVLLLSISVWAGAGGATREMFHWLSALIALPVIAYSGRPFFSSAWMALRYRRTNMDVPISIGVLLATGLSLYETLSGGQHAYFESAIMLLFFLLAGRALDAAMRDKTRAGIGALLGQMGKSASVIGLDGSTKRVPADQLEVGMIVLVAAGEAFAADGIVEEGEAVIDNALLTGESTPERVVVGDLVHAGASNLGPPIQVRLTAVADDTAIAEIARLMDEAGQSRSRYVRIADRASRAYAPLVHSLSFLAFVGWMLAGAGWHQSLVIAIAVLIITCPCAIGLAVPAAQVVASGALIKRGLLVKDGSALERLAECDMTVFDKTGTLTHGELRAEVGELGEEQQSVALGLAQASRHPLSRSLADELRRRAVTPAQISDICEETGAGLHGKWHGVDVALERPDAASGEVSAQLRIGADRYRFHFDEELRSDVRETLDALQSQGLAACILSGDTSAKTAALAEKLGIEATASASPQDKFDMLGSLEADGHRVLMVGDGLNDGPALAAANASIAPASASDVSQQSADAVFIGEKLMPVALAVRVARRTMRIVRENFFFSIVYNMLAVPLAVLGYVTPLIAALAMSLSSLIVVANSLRLARSAR